MRPEDELDALLSDSAQAQRAGSEFRPLISAAARLAPLRDATPDRAFADDLEARLMAHMEQRAMTLPIHAVPPSPLAPPAHRLLRVSPRVAWAATAAALLLTIGLGALTAKASPGAPLYAVRQFAQTLAAQALATPPADPTVALARAQADLQAFQTASASKNEAATIAALTKLRADDALASRQAAAISDTVTRQSIQAQISDFRTSAQTDLRASLVWLDWQSRVKVTDVLRGWEDTSLTVSEIDIKSDSASSDNGGQKPNATTTTLITVRGTGFTTGTRLLLNGAPIGVSVSFSATQFVMRVPTSTLNTQESLDLALAVANPDGTVAIARDTQHDDQGQSATPGTGDHGGDHGGSGDSSGKTPEATATTNPEATASPNGSGGSDTSGGGDATPTPSH